MRRRIVALLAIFPFYVELVRSRRRQLRYCIISPGLTLRVSLRHNLGGGRQKNQQVHEAGRAHGGNRHEEAPTVARLEQARNACGIIIGSATGVGDGENERHSRLDAKVDGEQLRLHGGKLWPGQRLELDEAIDKGLALC